KAGFAVKMLMKPLLPQPKQVEPLFARKEIGETRLMNKRRLLIISFLYESHYYDGLVKNIELTLDADSIQKSTLAVEHDVVSLYPGFISAEVFLSKVVRRLEQRQLDGSPYSGVIIDGLHNVFLQFPRLEGPPILWPVLHEICRIFGVTV